MKTTVHTLNRILTVDINNIQGIYLSKTNRKLFELVLKDNPKPYLLKSSAFRLLTDFIKRHKNGATS